MSNTISIDTRFKLQLLPAQQITNLCAYENISDSKQKHKTNFVKVLAGG